MDQLGIRVISAEAKNVCPKTSVSNTFQAPSRLCPDTVQTQSRHYLDIVWLISLPCFNFSCGWIQHLSETVHTLFGRCPYTAQTLYRLFLDSRQYMDIVWLISKACFKFSCGWVAGGWLGGWLDHLELMLPQPNFGWGWAELGKIKV